MPSPILIGFVYSGMPPQDAANHLMHNIKQSAQPVLDAGSDAVVPIYSGRRKRLGILPSIRAAILCAVFTMRRNVEPGVEAVTVSESIARHQNFGKLEFPCSRLLDNNVATFNVWIYAPEDNRAWDYLYQARDFYANAAPAATGAQRKLAFEELLIAVLQRLELAVRSRASLGQ